MSHEPAIDKDRETQYHTRESFLHDKLPHYITKAKSKKHPFGVILLRLGEAYREGTDDERRQTALKVKDVIDNIALDSITMPGAKISFDVKSRDENSYHLLMRVADEIECGLMLHRLEERLKTKGYGDVKLVARSYNPVHEKITPESVMSDLEQKLV